MTGPVSVTLAEAAAAVRWHRLADDVRDRAQDVLLDTVAVMAGGAPAAPHRKLRRTLRSGAGPATLIGEADPAPVGEAVLLNATLPTVLQLDEGYRVSRGHPGIHVVPVALAVGEQLDRSLDDVLSALVAGYEVAARIGRSLGGTRPEIPPHGNWGAVGAAVTAAWLYGDRRPEVLAAAIDAASGVAGYHDRRAAKAGAGVHHLWASIGAHTGLVAGAAAASGFDPVPGTLEDSLLPRSGVAPDVALLAAGLGADGFTDFAVGANYFKFWAACGHAHTAIGAALDLARSNPVAEDEIETVEVCTFAAAAGLDATDAANDLAARFSIPFVVAAALLDGEFTADSVADPALPRLRPLAARVHVRHDRALDADYPERGRPLQLRVRLRDGSVLERSASLSDGDAERPAPRERVHEKARMLFARAFGDDAAPGIVAAYLALRPDDPIGRFGAALRDAAKEGARR